jgi:hypothetical protein
MPIKFCLPQRLNKLAEQANMEVKEGLSGHFEIRKRGEYEVLARFFDEDAAKAWLVKTVDQNGANIDGSVPHPTQGFIAPSGPNSPQAQLTPLRRQIKAWQTSILKSFVPIHQHAANIETLTGINTSTGIWQVLNGSRVTMDRIYATVKKAALKTKDGVERTAQKALHDLSILGSKVNRSQQRLATLYSEAFSQEEIAKAGNFLARDMNEAELAASRLFQEGGAFFNIEIPTMLRRIATAKNFLREREITLTNRVPAWRQAILEGKAPQILEQDIDRIIAGAGTEKTELEIFRTMGMNDQEINLAAIMNAWLSKEVGPDKLNILAVYRHSKAPKLRPGFQSGRTQFAADTKMVPDAVRMGEERMTLIRDAFDSNPEGFSADQVVFGQQPVFRQFADVGYFPGHQVGAQADEFNNAAMAILNTLPEGREVLSRRVLSGHINIHELDPTASARKHINNMLFREHFDPHLESVETILKQLARRDEPQMYDMMANYVHEVSGQPNESFQALSQSLITLGRMSGFKFSERLAERWVNTLVRLSSQATIPFRPGIIARNGFQSPLFAIPVIGWKSWQEGVAISLGRDSTGGYSLKGMTEAIERGIKAGVIDANILPIHASSEIFQRGFTTGSRAKLLAQEWFDLGFSYYRKPDDVGRMVAFEGMRHKFNGELGAFVKGQIDLDTFVQRAKINTFDEVIETQARHMIQAGEYEGAANFLGKTLADKTHLLYANANHPPGWGGVAGRLFGQFGTFPVQYANYLIENGTRNIGSKAWNQFVVTHSALNMGVVVAGAELFDSDLTNWAAWGSLSYTGGPYADAVLNFVQLMSGSDAEQALARRNFQLMLPSFNSPQSPLVPGSYMAGDIVDAFQNRNDLTRAMLELGGIAPRRPGNESIGLKGFEWFKEIFR